MSSDDFTVVHPVAAGLDVHKMQITAAVRRPKPDAAGFESETRGFSALPSGLRKLCDWLVAQRVDAALMEATGVYWKAPFAALEDVGIPVMLVNARQVKQLKGRKTDAADSVWLAQVCQFDLAIPSMVPPQPFRELRKINRHARRLVQNNASIRNRVHKVLDDSGCRLGGVLTDIFGMNGRKVMRGLLNELPAQRILDSLSGHVRPKLTVLGDALNLTLSPIDRDLLQDLLKSHDDQLQRIDRFHADLRQRLKPWDRQLQLLQSIPGISERTAASLLAEIGPDLSPFKSIKQFCAWAGVTPGNHESAGKRKRVGVHRGSRHLSSILVEAAHAAARTKGCQFQSYQRSLVPRRGYQKAIMATAHKLARTIWAVLKSGQPYRDPEVDYEALLVDRNAARWIRQLEHFGYIGGGHVVWPAQ